LSARLRPWDRLYFAGVQFPDAAGDFAAPLLLGGRVHCIVQAFQQRTSQGGASLGRQCQRPLEKLGNIGSHGRILAAVQTATARSQISTQCHAHRAAHERLRSLEKVASRTPRGGRRRNFGCLKIALADAAPDRAGETELGSCYLRDRQKRLLDRDSRRR